MLIEIVTFCLLYASFWYYFFPKTVFGQCIHITASERTESFLFFVVLLWDYCKSITGNTLMIIHASNFTIF